MALQRGTDILIATPGRLLDLMNQGYVQLSDITHFVLDEADRMLDMGFINDLRKIIAKLPRQKQTMFFSATAAPEIMGLANSLLNNPVHVSVTPVSTAATSVQQSVYYIRKEDKRSLLNHLRQPQRGYHQLPPLERRVRQPFRRFHLRIDRP